MVCVPEGDYADAQCSQLSLIVGTSSVSVAGVNPPRLPFDPSTTPTPQVFPALEQRPSGGTFYLPL